jgi:putative transposase
VRSRKGFAPISLTGVRARYPFRIDAVCLLPEHLHCIWTLPEGDSDYAVRWKEIKRLFTRGYLKAVGPGGARNASRQRRGGVFGSTRFEMRLISAGIWKLFISTR